jgi:hypothetical protein
VKIITDNISKKLDSHCIAVGARGSAEFQAAPKWTAWRLDFQPQRTPAAGRFVGLSTRTLKKYRYKEPAIVEITFNPDGPLWVGRLREDVPATRGIFLGVESSHGAGVSPVRYASP